MWSAPVNPGVGASPGHIRLISTDESRCSDARPSAVPLGTSQPAGRQPWPSCGASCSPRATRCGSAKPNWRPACRWCCDDDDTNAPAWRAARSRLARRRRSGRLPGRGSVPARSGDHRIEAPRQLGPAPQAADRAGPAAARRAGRSGSPAGPRRRYDRRPVARSLESARDRTLSRACACRSRARRCRWARCGSFAASRAISATSQTNILEVVAGRLAADLERQVLVDEVLSSRGRQRSNSPAAERSQQDQLPRIAPMIEGWEIAAKAYHAGPIGGTFYDWFSLGDGGLECAGGRCDGARRGRRADGRSLAGCSPRAWPACARAATAVGKGQHDSLDRLGRQCRAGRFHATLQPCAPKRCALPPADRCGVLAVSPMASHRWRVPLRPWARTKSCAWTARAAPFGCGELLLAYGTSFLSDTDELILAALDQRLAVML